MGVESAKREASVFKMSNRTVKDESMLFHFYSYFYFHYPKGSLFHKS